MVMMVSDSILVDKSLQNHFLAAWYSGPQQPSEPSPSLSRTSTRGPRLGDCCQPHRVVLASSPDAEVWTAPVTVFDAVNAKGEENEPFAVIKGRLYATASDANLGNAHDSGIR